MAEPEPKPAGSAYQEQGSRPVPDPTTLTTEQLMREVLGLKENIQALKELMGSELEGMEGVFVERFESINTQFQLIERQRVEQKTDTSDAVSAALAAAKEAVTKNEEQTKDALAALQATLTTAITGLEVRLNDTMDRITKIESARQGAIEQRGEQRAVVQEKQAGISSTTAIIGSIIAVVGFALALLVGHNTANSKPSNIIVQPPTVTTTTP